MSSLLKGKQIPVAASISLRATTLAQSLREMAQDAALAGLYEHSAALTRAADEASRAAGGLDRAARDAFCAARRGEALPE